MYPQYFNAPLKIRFPPHLRHRDTGNKCIRRCAKSPLKIKTASHCCCAMQLWFIPMLRTGIPESSAPHLRYARQPWFPPQLRHRDTGNKCIRRCAKSPLKIKTASHCCCAMQLWFIPMFRTGPPESSVPHLRYARQPRFPPQPRTGLPQ